LQGLVVIAVPHLHWLQQQLDEPAISWFGKVAMPLSHQRRS
jgi:hypothetical protein